MKVNYQFKDGVTFAYVISDNIVENSIQIETENPDDFLLKSLDADGNWQEAPSFKYAIVNKNGRITEIRNTYFPSEIKDNPIMSDEVEDYWVWNGTEFVPPAEPAL